MKWRPKRATQLLSMTLWLVAVPDHEVRAQVISDSTTGLRHAVEQVLAERNTPGASVAVVRRGEPAWVAGLGAADVASGRVASSETLFRIGSVSKSFVALAVLFLVDRGRLSLNDPVRTLVPEIRFDNAWESSDPIRVVHLLEHTTGWDDIHLRDYAKDGSSMRLRDALEYGSNSRVSRWRPGTRMAYCNSGPAVAAYIVEKLTGQVFEVFVAQNLFVPIGMRTAMFFQPPATSAATVYRRGGSAALPYWNMLYRPSGAINASASDMAAYLQFVLNRGTSAGTRILATSSIERMETPRSTWAAQRGLTTGYGLTTAALIREGFVWHGHTGEINGGLSELWYVPEHGIGYFTSINSDNGFDSFRIGQAIRQNLTRGLPQPAVPMLAALPADAPNYQGWYEPASPRMQLFHFVQRITDLAVVRVEDGTLTIRSAAGVRRYVPVGDRQFRRIYDSGPQDPVATLILLDTDEGRFVQIGTETSVMRRVPAWVVMLELTTIAYVLLSVLAVLLYAPFWVIGGLRQTSSRRRERMLRAWPLISVVSLVTAALLLGAASDDPITNLGTPTVWSVGLWITTYCFLGSVIASVVALWLTPSHTVRSSLRRFTIGATVALVLVCGYLAYWGVIGLRTWA